MTQPAQSPLPSTSYGGLHRGPFLRAAEASGGIFTVLLACAGLVLIGGIFFFGWRALLVAAISIATCVVTEAAYFHLTRTPSLAGRKHAALTGLLLALTLPPFVPWYVPLVGGVFAIVVGKAIFGGVGHFLWQPALVGRLAVAVIFATPAWPANELTRPLWPVLAANRVIVGDIRLAADTPPPASTAWRDTASPPEADAFVTTPPRQVLARLTTAHNPRPADSILQTLQLLPAMPDMLLGAYGGEIGQTCVLVIVVAGLYLVYRNYASGHIAAMMLLAAAVTAAIAPVRTAASHGQWQFLPLVAEGWDVGFVYVVSQVLGGGVLLAAFFLATEMTSRPVTPKGQVVFGLLCGTLAVLLGQYTDIPIPAYAAVLICNTFTPLLDRLRPRVLGEKRK